MLDFLDTLKNIENKKVSTESLRALEKKKASLCIVRFGDQADFPVLLASGN